MFFLRILFLSVLAFAQLDARESHAPFIFLGSSVYTRFGKSSIPRLRDPASWPRGRVQATLESIFYRTLYISLFSGCLNAEMRRSQNVVSNILLNVIINRNGKKLTSPMTALSWYITLAMSSVGWMR